MTNRELAAARQTLPKLQGKNRALLQAAVEKLERALAKHSISTTLGSRKESDDVQR
jgi:transposase